MHLPQSTLGAKAMGYWRDCFKACNKKLTKSVGPVAKKPWWPDFPHLRREVDRLLPVIREPHWTTWKVKVDPPHNVRVGTRDHKGEGYMILVNQTNHPQTVTVTIESLGYTPQEVRGVLNNKKLASINDSSFSITLPKIGVNSGTNVVRLVSPGNNP